MNCLKIMSRAALCAVAIAAHGQNPVIRDQFTADPTARVFNGKVYLYPSHDIHSPVERLKEWFCMEDYHVFSSADLVDWTDHGVIVTQNRVPWVQPDSYAMWAPDCVEKDGRYWFYFPAAPRGEEKGFAIGVAVSDSPEGPFRPMFRPIEGIRGIDPCVLVDDDGKSYIYWSGMGMSGARLKPSMTELDGEPVRIQGLPEGFKEGPFVFKREGRYYFTFPWVREKNGTECLAYAMSDTPLGPYEFKGIIMAESPTRCWTNHHSIVEYGDRWYLFYHHNDYSPDMDKRRSVRIDTLAFNADGTIREVMPTLRGVGVADGNRRIQTDRYSAVSPKGVAVEFLDTLDRFKGWKSVFSGKGSWLRYDRVKVSEGTSEVTLRGRSAKGAVIEVSAGTPGNVVARVRIPAGKEWSDSRAAVTGLGAGVTDLWLRLAKGSRAEVDWIGFGTLPWEAGAARTGQYRNLFAECGYPQAEIDSKVDSIFNAMFFGPDRVYFEVGDSLGYVSDLKNHDVRSEGMSYGMMAAVQFGRKDIFDRLWRWARKYMQHHDGEMKGYFAWSCKTDGTRNSQGAASDGELYIVTSLLFASNLWGDGTGIDYGAEARNILDNSMMKTGMEGAAPLVHTGNRLITFTPDRFGSTFTDPSYHVPAFYEVWADWAKDGRSRFWRECAAASREYLHRAVHPETGLTPDYSNYDGTLLGRGFVIGDCFRFDSWRVPMNIALDYSWSGADAAWQREYADRIQGFFHARGIDGYVDQYNVDGSEVAEVLQAGGVKKLRHSLGLVSTLGAASLASTHTRGREFVDRLWHSVHEPYDDGYFDAYYDGFLRLFAFMHLSGRYRLITPP